MIETLRSLKKKKNQVDGNLKDLSYSVQPRMWHNYYLPPKELDITPNCGTCLAAFLNIKVHISIEPVSHLGLSNRS